MALAGWLCQSRENGRKLSFSNGGNVAENTVEVKAGKFLVLQFAGCRYVLSLGSARASRAVFGALAEHTIRSAGRRPVQRRRLRSPHGALNAPCPQPTTPSDSFTNPRGDLIVRSGPVPIRCRSKSNAHLTYL